MATGLERHSAPRRPAFERLSRQDLANLIVEAPDTPMHMAVLTILDGRLTVQVFMRQPNLALVTRNARTRSDRWMTRDGIFASTHLL